MGYITPLEVNSFGDITPPDINSFGRHKPLGVNSFGDKTSPEITQNDAQLLIDATSNIFLRVT